MMGSFQSNEGFSIISIDENNNGKPYSTDHFKPFLILLQIKKG